jgi:hypothetical protein
MNLFCVHIHASAWHPSVNDAVTLLLFFLKQTFTHSAKRVLQLAMTYFVWAANCGQTTVFCHSLEAIISLIASQWNTIISIEMVWKNPKKTVFFSSLHVYAHCRTCIYPFCVLDRRVNFSCYEKFSIIANGWPCPGGSFLSIKTNFRFFIVRAFTILMVNSATHQS